MLHLPRQAAVAVACRLETLGLSAPGDQAQAGPMKDSPARKIAASYKESPSWVH